MTNPTTDTGLAPGAADLPKVKARWILLITLAVFGAYIAWITPMAITMAIRVKALAPDNEEFLGIILGVGSFAALIVSPLLGQFSDRTRTALGRRRPWMIGGTVVGVLGCLVMGLAPSIVMLGLGWVITQIGYSQAVNNMGAAQADKLPEHQRGKVAGLTGFATMVAPVFGAVIGGALSSDSFLMFVVPAIVSVVFVGLFVLIEKEADSRGLVLGPLDVKRLFANYVFNPRRFPDFGWNWLARFLVFFGLTLNTTYTAYFFSLRLGIPVADIGGTVALVGIIGVLGTSIGAFGSGFLSDKVGRRKPFVIGSGILFGIGSLITLTAFSLPVLILGAVLANLAIGVFSAVDQALLLDILPERDTDAARYLAISGFTSTIPQAIAPVAAAGLLLIGASGGDKNYAIVYIASAVFAVAGAVLFFRIKSVR